MTLPRSLARLPWRRYRAIATLLSLYLLWLVLAEPLILILVGSPMDTEDLLDALPVAEGATAALLALLFTWRGRWGATGFRGGIAVAPLLALWPVWAPALIYFTLDGLSIPLTAHLRTIAFAFCIGFSEEAIFRGALFQMLMQRGPRSAILWSSLWFAAFHLMNFPLMGWPATLLAVMGTFAMGTALGWVRWASASIWPGILAHAFYDYASLLDGVPTHISLSTNLLLSEGGVIVLTLAWSGWLLTRNVTPGALRWAALNPLAIWRKPASPITLNEGKLAS